MELFSNEKYFSRENFIANYLRNTIISRRNTCDENSGKKSRLITISRNDNSRKFRNIIQMLIYS